MLLVAVALGADNLAAAIGLGVSGVDNRARLRVGLVFGFFEAVMPLVGFAIGRGAAQHAGSATRDLGAALLVAVGVYTIALAARERAPSKPRGDRGGRLIVTGIALSVDNLVVGFALESFAVPFLVVAAVVAVVSVGMTMVGLELGSQLGDRTGERGELIGGVVLVIVGVALATGLLN